MTDVPTAIDPEQTALLVMDYQAAIVGMIPDADELVARAAAAIDMARGSGVQIGYVRVAFANSDYAAIPETNKSFAMLAARGPGYLRDDSPEAAIDDRVAPQPGDIVVRKVRVGAFSTTDLDQQLRGRGITTLILAGISTSGVVLSTVRDAADRDYRLFVLVDACADPDAEVHDVLTQKVFPRQADVVSVADLAGLLVQRLT